MWVVGKHETMTWQWHQMDHMRIICTSLQHLITQFLYRPNALPNAQPTVSKHWRQKMVMMWINRVKKCLPEAVSFEYNLQTHTQLHCQDNHIWVLPAIYNGIFTMTRQYIQQRTGFSDNWVQHPVLVANVTHSYVGKTLSQNAQRIKWLTRKPVLHAIRSLTGDNFINTRVYIRVTIFHAVDHERSV